MDAGSCSSITYLYIYIICYIYIYVYYMLHIYIYCSIYIYYIKYYILYICVCLCVFFNIYPFYSTLIQFRSCRLNPEGVKQVFSAIFKPFKFQDGWHVFLWKTALRIQHVHYYLKPVGLEKRMLLPLKYLHHQSLTARP